MNNLKHTCTFTLVLLSFFIGSDGIAQLAIGQWRDHLSYKKGIAVTQNAENVYCATESGMFVLKKSDNSIERLSKISGLSDVGIKTIRCNDINNALLIAYDNANIDLLKGGTIYNISDIKRSIITAKKTINNIFFRNELAYLSCGFGIVVLDLDKKEIKDTYYIGINGGFMNVHEVSADANYLYAATDSGVYWASLQSPYLANFNSWHRFAALPTGTYNTIASCAGKTYANYSAPPNKPWGYDTIYVYDGTHWNHFLKPDTSFRPVRKIEESQNKLFISYINYADVYDSAEKKLGTLNSYVFGYDIDPFQCIADKNNPDVYWIADNYNGLTKNNNFWGGTESYTPNGPNTSDVYTLNFANGDLWVARGDRSEIWIGTYHPAEAYKFSSGTWYSITRQNMPALDTIRDIVAIAVDPADKEHVYLGSIGAGLLEIKNGSLVNIWTEQNSSLQALVQGTYRRLGILGCTFDKEGNLWVSNPDVASPISVRKADGTWLSFNSSEAVTAPTTSQIIVDKSNQKWLVMPRGVGILVFDQNGTWATGDDKIKKLSSLKGSGNLPSNNVSCLAEDQDGEIWVGTDKGIAVFYCADQVFSSSGCDAQQIFIEQDGHTQLLLETEVVTAIAIDGANRKWIGTQNSGVYLMSPDGTTQIQHFTAENSFLLSNEIRSLAIDSKTGEVFFGTANGIISYRNDAIDGLEDYTNVYVFPNPVKPGYDGPIAITGLITNANVKITDISGTLVYQTKAFGGQAIWYGKNFKGEKARSGVYMVFCSNDDGTKTYITKILLVN